MPELPEVETIKRGLSRHLVGHIITKVSVQTQSVVKGNRELVEGRKVIGIRRFGKGLVIDMEDNISIAVHVKMTGQLIFTLDFPSLENKYPNKWTRVIFTLRVKPSSRAQAEGNKKSQRDLTDQGCLREACGLRSRIKDKRGYLFFNDIRKFGWIQIVKAEEVNNLPFFKNLGLEPLKELTLEDFKKILKTSKAPIKSLLMNQQKIAGIGNIYANEALFMAKIHPARLASSLTAREQGELFKAIEDVLQKGIAAGGASDVNFINALGEKGTFQNHFQVYKKEEKPCVRCKTPIKRIKIAGRSSFFCPNCQKRL